MKWIDLLHLNEHLIFTTTLRGIMDYEELLDFYFEKSGDSKITKENYIENEFGFSTHRVVDDQLVLLNVCGNGSFWDSFFCSYARELGLNKIVFGTKRNPKTFERKHGYRLVGYILEKEL